MKFSALASMQNTVFITGKVVLKCANSLVLKLNSNYSDYLEPRLTKDFYQEEKFNHWLRLELPVQSDNKKQATFSGFIIASKLSTDNTPLIACTAQPPFAHPWPSTVLIPW